MIKIREFNSVSDEKVVKKIFYDCNYGLIGDCIKLNLFWWPSYFLHSLFIVASYFAFKTFIFIYIVLLFGFVWNIKKKIINYIDYSFKTDLMDINKYYDGKKGCFWIAENDQNEIVGHIALDATQLETNQSVELRRCAVPFNYRNQGIAIKLTKHLILNSKNQFKAKSIFLTTMSIPAIKLYQKVGFKITNVEKQILNLKIVRMEYNLD